MLFRGITQDCVRVLRRRNALSHAGQTLYNGNLFDGLGGYC
jgi:hypothetical protein